MIVFNVFWVVLQLVVTVSAIHTCILLNFSRYNFFFRCCSLRVSFSFSSATQAVVYTEIDKNRKETSLLSLYIKKCCVWWVLQLLRPDHAHRAESSHKMRGVIYLAHMKIKIKPSLFGQWVIIKHTDWEYRYHWSSCVS